MSDAAVRAGVRAILGDEGSLSFFDDETLRLLSDRVTGEHHRRIRARDRAALVALVGERVVDIHLARFQQRETPFYASALFPNCTVRHYVEGLSLAFGSKDRVSVSTRCRYGGRTLDPVTAHEVLNEGIREKGTPAITCKGCRR